MTGKGGDGEDAYTLYVGETVVICVYTIILGILKAKRFSPCRQFRITAG